MARPRRTNGSRRYFVTVSLKDAERIESYAAAVDRRPTTVAGDLLRAGLAVATGEVDDDLAAAKRRIEELEHQLAAVFKAHRPPEPTDTNHTRARWEWPIEDLLVDDAWWDRWLPRLYELLGRNLQDTGSKRAHGLGQAQPVVDSRGYGDLMSYLFPPVQANGRELTWRSVDYPKAAVDAARQETNESVLPSSGPMYGSRFLDTSPSRCAPWSTARGPALTLNSASIPRSASPARGSVPSATWSETATSSSCHALSGDLSCNRPSAPRRGQKK